MKFPRFIAIFILIWSFQSCSKDETPSAGPISIQPEPEKPEEPAEPEDDIYFSYYDDPNFFIVSSSENWMMIHNQDGTLLDYRSFKKGDSLDFRGSVEKLKNTNALSVTILKSSSDNVNTYNISTTTDIKKGSVWSWTNSVEGYIPTIPHPQGTERSQYNIVVNEVPNIAWNTIASQSDFIEWIDTDYRQTNTLEINDIKLHSDFSYIFTIRDGNDQLKYTLLDLPDSTGDIILDYSEDFLVYDSVLEIDLPEHELYRSEVLARNWNTNYEKSLYMSVDNSYGQKRDKALLGYLDGYDWFFTSFVVYYNDTSQYQYYGSGDIPEMITVPVNPQFEVLNKNIYSFEWATEVEFIQYNSYWYYYDINNSSSTSYSLIGKSENESILGTMPEELLDKYPSMDLDKLEYKRTTLNYRQNPDFDFDNRTTFFGNLKTAFFESLRFVENED